MKRGHDGSLPQGQPVAAEFSRPLDLGDLPDDGLAVTLTADEAECGAVADRLGLRKVAGLRFDGRLARDYMSDGYRLVGELSAAVTQTCVVSLEPVEAAIRSPVQRAFVVAEPGALPVEEGEIDPAAEDPPDPVPGGVVDLGEVATEELALALDPYPRKPGAAWSGSGDGEDGAEGAKPNPFAVLRQLKH